MLPQSDLLDLKEAASFLRVKPATLYAWIYQRRIPFRKHGRRVIFSREELAKWSESQAVPPRAGVPWSGGDAHGMESPAL